MQAEHRENPTTKNSAYRVIRITDDLRDVMSDRRRALSVTLRAFVKEAVAHELPSLVRAVQELLPAPGGKRRPIRLPLNAEMLANLKGAAEQTGLSATLLLQASLAKAASRKRRAKGATTAPPVSSPEGGSRRRGRKSSVEAQPTSEATSEISQEEGPVQPPTGDNQ
jgi:hypothetical protein